MHKFTLMVLIGYCCVFILSTVHQFVIVVLLLFDPCPWFWIFIYRNGHVKILWL